MTHVAHERLWAYARKELTREDAAAVEAHLALCHQCTLAVEDVAQAQALLSALPPAPPMPEAMARRVGAALADEVERQAVRRFSWWPFEARPALVLAGAAAVALVAVAAWTLTRPAPAEQPVAKQDAPAPAPPPSPAPPEAGPKKKLTVQVASAKRAKSNSSSLKKQQRLEEGATVATETGGALWLNLPDGTRAGLTGGTEVQLAKLEEKTLTLDVAKGSLALVVAHREDRVLVVRAGEVVVKDLGTRFMVSREPARVLVAVEEGSVEVTMPGRTETVAAGRAVEWHDGKYESFPWAPAQPPVKTAVRPGRPAEPQTPPIPEGSAARLSGEDDADELPPPPEPQPPQAVVQAPPAAVQAPPAGSPEDEWAAPPASPTGPAGQPPGEPPLPPGPPPPPPGTVTTATPPQAPMAPAATPPRAERGFSLRELERRLDELRRGLHLPVVVVMGDPREARMRELSELADRGDCGAALSRANAWLQERPGASPNEPRWRRTVLTQKLRCLTRLGFPDEAAAVQRELER